jgi:phenylacetate-CoA ligase
MSPLLNGKLSKEDSSKYATNFYKKLYKNKNIQLNDIENYLSNIKSIISYAYVNCPFYTKKFNEAGLRPDDIRYPDDISKIPTISKEEIQEKLGEMISKEYNKNFLIKDMTGGSTGSPLVFYYDVKRMDSRNAATIRHNRWAGWDIGDKTALLWGAVRDTKVSEDIKNSIKKIFLNRNLILDASSINKARMSEFAKSLLTFKPKVILAYANTMALFARFVKEQNIKGISPASIICSAEVLTEENRKLIEETFNSLVFNRYGCREFAVIASECEYHEGMHINAENLLVEIVSDGKPVIVNEGEILITDLRNFAMPLIRYRIKDIGHIKTDICECSRGLPVIELTGGRVTDFLVAADGTRVSGVAIATYVITNIPGIKQIQFIQDTKEQLKVKLVKNKEFTEDSLNKLNCNIIKFLGNKIKIKIEYVDNIPMEKSGKYRFSISTIQTNF